MSHTYLLSDWINFVEELIKLQESPKSEIALGLKSFRDLILDLTKLVIIQKNQSYLPVHFVVELKESEEESELLCFIRVLPNSTEQESKFYRSFVISRDVAVLLFSLGRVWIATNLKQNLKLILDPSL